MIGWCPDQYLLNSQGASDDISPSFADLMIDSGRGSECRTIAPYRPYSAMIELRPQRLLLFLHLALLFWNQTWCKRQMIFVLVLGTKQIYMEAVHFLRQNTVRSVFWKSLFWCRRVKILAITWAQPNHETLIPIFVLPHLPLVGKLCWNWTLKQAVGLPLRPPDVHILDTGKSIWDLDLLAALIPDGCMRWKKRGVV